MTDNSRIKVPYKITYGAITPLTFGDLGRPEALSHSSSSSANFLAEEGNKVPKCQANLKRPSSTQ